MSKIWILTILVLLCSFSVCAAESPHEGYYTLVDEGGNIVYLTGWKVRVGDECLTENNKRYEITAIEGTRALVKYLGTVNLAQYDKNYVPFASKFMSTANAQSAGKVAIYHTHSDESYVPTDGKDSIYGNGGIYKVGDAFTNALQAKGIEVFHSMAKHDPHDDMAYERSRRTAMDLLKQKPDAIFDVHRDSTPPEVYHAVINGQDVSKVQLVVGKYGPTGKQIEDYAMQIKANADKQHPGLIKGIFFAKGGDYNQDLFPRSMLLEVGSATNDRPSAERGIALFADVVPTIIGKTGPNQANQAGATGFGTTQSGFSGATKATGWIIGLLIVGGVAFLLLSTGSMKEAGSKLKQFSTKEFANFLAPRKKKIKEDDDKEKNNE